MSPAAISSAWSMASYFIHAVAVAHAWVCRADGSIYDPVENQSYSAEGYGTARGALEERCYSKLEAAKLMLEHGHMGPWHESAGIGAPSLAGRKKGKKRKGTI
jgi:hypothetical protein